MAPGAPQLHALTGLRGAAAVVIMLFHAQPAISAQTSWAKWLDCAYIAVDLFFAISGFVIFHV